MRRSSFNGTWLAKRPSVQVVSHDSLNMDATQLQHEVLRLQARIRKLIALLRVLLVVLKISRFSLNQTRLPDGNDKRSLLTVIDQARSALPLRSVLRALRLSSSRYHHWKRENQCALDDGHRVHEFAPSSSQLPRLKRSMTWQRHMSIDMSQLGHWRCSLNALARSLLRRARGID